MLRNFYVRDCDRDPSYNAAIRPYLQAGEIQPSKTEWVLGLTYIEATDPLDALERYADANDNGDMADSTRDLQLYTLDENGHERLVFSVELRQHWKFDGSRVMGLIITSPPVD